MTLVALSPSLSSSSSSSRKRPAFLMIKFIKRWTPVFMISIVSIAMLLSASFGTSNVEFFDFAASGSQSSKDHYRQVSFLQGDAWSDLSESYSGMWWQSVDGFLSVDWVGLEKLENASFWAFKNNRVRKTKDWFDLSVTHLSILWKHFERKQSDEDMVAFRLLEKYLDEFIQAAKPLPILEGSPAPDTIAVVPAFASASKLKKHYHDIPEKALLITLVSMWESGIARSVVACGANPGSQAEVQRIQSALALMDDKLKQRPMELQFILLTNLTDYEKQFMPETALHGLELALRGKMSDEATKQWLGKRRDWKFVYFTEPDLVLHARPSAMKAFKEEMEAGSTLSGHRFDVIPHEDNFPGYKRMDKVLPRIFLPLPAPIDVFDETLSCCDAGQHYPANLKDPTKQISIYCRDREFWWHCGFRDTTANYSSLESLNKVHEKLRGYSLLRFRERLPFPFLDEHQHICHFHADGTLCR